MKTTKTIKRIVSFILLTAVLSSISVNYVFAAENKFDETEYLKQFISEEYIVDDKVIQEHVMTSIKYGKSEYSKYFSGYHDGQPGNVIIHFQPVNPNPELLNKLLNYEPITYDEIKRELGQYINLDNESWGVDVVHPFTGSIFLPTGYDYDKYEFVIYFILDDELSDLDVYYLRRKLYMGIAMSLEAGGALKTENGMYMHSGMFAAGGTEIIEGDINLDGRTGVRDMLLLKKYIAGMSPRVLIDACDLNSDGKINAMDTIALKKILVG